MLFWGVDFTNGNHLFFLDILKETHFFWHFYTYRCFKFLYIQKGIFSSSKNYKMKDYSFTKILSINFAKSDKNCRSSQDLSNKLNFLAVEQFLRKWQSFKWKPSLAYFRGEKSDSLHWCTPSFLNNFHDFCPIGIIST